LFIFPPPTPSLLPFAQVHGLNLSAYDDAVVLPAGAALETTQPLWEFDYRRASDINVLWQASLASLASAEAAIEPLEIPAQWQIQGEGRAVHAIALWLVFAGGPKDVVEEVRGQACWPTLLWPFSVFSTLKTPTTVHQAAHMLEKTYARQQVVIFAEHQACTSATALTCNAVISFKEPGVSLGEFKWLS
jgi:hypothetical protein